MVDAGRTDASRLDPPLLTALMTTASARSAVTCRSPTIPSACSRRCSPSRIRASTPIPASNPFRRSRRRSVTNLFGDSAVPRRRQHDHAAARRECSSSTTSSTSRLQAATLASQARDVMSLVLERRATKDEILELYLNDVYLGQRGSFAIHGVAEAARIFFGKDVSNLTLAEAALIAGVIQRPSTLSPFPTPNARVERRNVVLQAMADADYITERRGRAARRGAARSVVARALDNEAPYFVDYRQPEVERAVTRASRRRPARSTSTPRSTSTCSGSRRTRSATGSRSVDKLLARRKRTRPRAGGAHRRRSAHRRDPRDGRRPRPTTSRSSTAPSRARRQPGSVFKPFVYLAAFERAGRGRTHRPHAGDARRRRADDVHVRRPGRGRRELRDEYDGAITLRRALAHVAQHRARSRSAEASASTRRRRCGAQSASARRRRRYPVDRARRVRGDAARDRRRPTRCSPTAARCGRCAHRPRIDAAARPTLEAADAAAQTVARPDTTYLVTNMMRSVINEGTGAGARARRLHPRRRRQDGHDQRPARRLVRRLHAGAADGRLGRASTTTSRSGCQRLAGGAAHLDRAS